MQHAYSQAADDLTLVSLPYLPDSEGYARALAALPNLVWLDSGRDRRFKEGRYDIISAKPATLLTTIGQTTQIQSKSGATTSDANPFDLVAEALADLPANGANDLPFAGGAMGYFGYHLNTHLENLPPRPPATTGMPDMVVGIYHWGLVQDHLGQKTVAVFLPSMPQSERDSILALLSAAPTNESGSNLFRINKLKAKYNLNYYQQKLARIHQYLLAGDIYQVNFAQSFHAEFEGQALDGFCHLRQALPAPYGAFVQCDKGAVLSHSPELFLQIDNNRVLTQPIKGTRPRGDTATEDQRLITDLLNSAKDKAENLMIVDLLRNDLGRHCQPGSIRVPDLFQLRSFANVHHLVSSVVGHLQPGSHPIDLLKACFPGGSITGAPKIRAMEIIHELEEVERSAYCGSIGYIGADGRMSLNIAIRTLVASGGQIFAWAGGGIVADSDPEAEYQECLDKIGILLRSLENAEN